jgi:hypothetical protein
VERISIGNLSLIVKEICNTTPVTDIHTHLFPSSFGALHLWGIDDLLNYHYLIPETIRAASIGSKDYFTLSPKDRADLTWRILFMESNPYSESCRGVVKILSALIFLRKLLMNIEITSIRLSKPTTFSVC